MDDPHRSNPAEHSRRAVLTSALGAGAAALLGGCGSIERLSATSAAGTAIDVDFGTAEYFPLLKSKIGVGRALSSPEILDSLQHLDRIRPALYDAEIRFPDTGYPSLTPYPFAVGADGEISVQRNEFLDELFTGLRDRNIEIMVQLEGGPQQFWDYSADDRPHLFPKPDDLARSAEAIGKWAELYAEYPISWCTWNEPSHTLTGSPDRLAVKQMTDIYSAYTNAIAPQGLFGMASFITPSTTARPALGGRTHLEASIDALRERRREQPALPFDYLTLNNYGEELGGLFDGARNALGTDFDHVPLIQAQSGVFLPHDWEKRAGSTLEAVRSTKSLQHALRVPDLQTFTFSGWIPHLITYKRGRALELPLFHALELYARMPERRSAVRGLPAGMGAMAASDPHRSAVLLWNESEQPQTVDLRLAGLRNSADAEVRVHHIDAEHGSPLEGGDGTFEPTEVTALDRATGPVAKTVTVAGPGIAYVEVGAAAPHPVLDRAGLAAELVRKHTHADRTASPDGSVSVRGNAYGCYDAVRAIAYVGVDADDGTAVVGAEYRGLPGELPVQVEADGPAARPGSAEAMFGIRVDYLQQGRAVRSVLWHGDTCAAGRTNALPWGSGGPTADVLVDTRELDRIRDGRAPLVLPLASRAPSGWAEAGAHAILSFWMDSTGPGSQARFVLG